MALLRPDGKPFILSECANIERRHFYQSLKELIQFSIRLLGQSPFYEEHKFYATKIHTINWHQVFSSFFSFILLSLLFVLLPKVLIEEKEKTPQTTKINRFTKYFSCLTPYFSFVYLLNLLFTLTLAIYSHLHFESI